MQTKHVPVLAVILCVVGCSQNDGMQNYAHNKEWTIEDCLASKKDEKLKEALSKEDITVQNYCADIRRAVHSKEVEVEAKERTRRAIDDLSARRMPRAGENPSQQQTKKQYQLELYDQMQRGQPSE